MADKGETVSALTDPTARGLVRAAQYVRMSTEHQRYSTENQIDAIKRYADRRGFIVVRTYEDAGKSGLRLDGRNSLKQLIHDVQNGNADFSVILVYDVSRWGRFQDADESAYYEFICKEAGITVHYCAEQFENDGSIGATIIKSVKRAMAGEYSRELSTKVFMGQCRLVSLGFRQGGMAGYGLRRQLIDEQRRAKAELARGEHKSLQTDRVILAPGPADEVETVRRMYRLFVDDGLTERQISRVLNSDGRLNELGQPWTRGTIHQILTNEKYVGNNIFNRVSHKLKGKRVKNSPAMWIRAEGAFVPLVDVSLFQAAQRIIQERSRRFTDAEMLARLADLLKAAGHLSGLVIDEREDMPSSAAYRHRFGTLLRAYQLVGYSPRRDYCYLEINRILRSLYPEIIAHTVAQIRQSGGAVARNPVTDLLSINDEFTASLVIVRCLQTPSGSLRWKVRLDTGLCPDITVVLRMDSDNREVRDYYLLPRLDLNATKFRLAEENGLSLDAYRFDTLDPFLALTARISIRTAA